MLSSQLILYQLCMYHVYSMLCSYVWCICHVSDHFPTLSPPSSSATVCLHWCVCVCVCVCACVCVCVCVCVCESEKERPRESFKVSVSFLTNQNCNMIAPINHDNRDMRIQVC